MDDATRQLFEQLSISFVLGLLVGLQRQHAESAIAGVRTFPLITVMGTLAAVLDRQHEASGWVLAAAFLGLALLVAVANYRMRRANPGLTTEVTALVMFAVGAYLAAGSRIVAIAVGAAVAVLLQFKGELHGLVRKLGDQDLRAIMTFVLITCVILPVLPNRTYGPFEVLNPFEVWLMVVLTVGISLGGYLIYKFLGQHAGVLLGGILGGAISSTATTISYARRTATAPNSARPAGLVVVIASTVVFTRVLLEIAVVAPDHLRQLSFPIIVMLLTSTAAAGALWLRTWQQPEAMPEQTNPSELKAAVIFGLIYASVRFAMAAAKEYFGGVGIYAIAALSGLTDMDAITLSTARLVQAGTENNGLSETDGWRLIVIAAMSNLIFKVGLVAVTGSRRLLLWVALLLAVPFFTGALMLWLWPTPAAA